MAQVGPVGDKIGSPRPALTQVSPGEPRVSRSPRLTQAHAAQGGVTLGLEQGELGANFCYLGFRRTWLASAQFQQHPPPPQLSSN